MPEPTLASVAAKQRRRGILKRNIIPGTIAFLGVFLFAEVALGVIADGHTDPNVRLFARAAALGAGTLVALLRGTGAAVVLAAVLGASSAHAADRVRDYTVTISSAACPTTGTPGLWTDGKTPGIAVSGLRYVSVTACPASGQTFTGVGGFKACAYRGAPLDKWVPLSQIFISMEADAQGNPITSTTDNPCVSPSWDYQMGVNDGDLLFFYPTTDLGVSGGTTVRLVLEGVL